MSSKQKAKPTSAVQLLETIKKRIPVGRHSGTLGAKRGDA